jgi:hypothetical protein
MNGYRLYWITDLGYAGTDNGEYETPEQAAAAATPGVDFKKYGREWRSDRSKYGDIFIIKSAGR